MISVLSCVLYCDDFSLLFDIACILLYSTVNFSTVSVAGKREELHFDEINAMNREHVRSHSFIISPTCRNYYLLSCHLYRTVYFLDYLPTGINKIKFYVLLLKLKIISWRNSFILEPKRNQNSAISA